MFKTNLIEVVRSALRNPIFYIAIGVLFAACYWALRNLGVSHVLPIAIIATFALIALAVAYTMYILK